MTARSLDARWRRAALAVVVPACLAFPAASAPLGSDELASVCADAEGPSHCGRLVEDVQLKRLPKLASREGASLKVTLVPAGIATFTDTEAITGGRSYSLWDYVAEIDAVLLYTVQDDDANFTLLLRKSGRKYELASEPHVSPDRARLVTADFCAKGCANEVVVWRVASDALRRESVWRPGESWADATAAWKSNDTLIVEYTPKPDSATHRLERRLDASGWTRPAAP